MRMSQDRILTSHVGSLPRPADLLAMLEDQQQQGGRQDVALSSRTSHAIVEIVERQIHAGIDIVNDGENSKTSYTLYVRDRLGGVGPRPADATPQQNLQHRDLAEHPNLVDRKNRLLHGTSW